MTDELIKQNAKQYNASKYRVMFTPDIEEAFIAGAHSRDEEIKTLEVDVKELEQALAFTEDVAYIQRQKIDQLEQQLQQANNDNSEKV